MYSFQFFLITWMDKPHNTHCNHLKSNSSWKFCRFLVLKWQWWNKNHLPFNAIIIWTNDCIGNLNHFELYFTISPIHLYHLFGYTSPWTRHKPLQNTSTSLILSPTLLSLLVSRCNLLLYMASMKLSLNFELSSSLMSPL